MKISKYLDFSELPDFVNELIKKYKMLDDGKTEEELFSQYRMVMVDDVVYTREKGVAAEVNVRGTNLDLIVKEGKVLKNRYGIIYRGLNIIFLDIDGVLAGYNYLVSGKGYIDPECVKCLNELEDIDAKIVISSSWGYDNGKTEESLRAAGLTLPIIGYTDHYYEEWLCRGNEIEKWLIDHYGGMCTKYGPEWSDNKYNYVILDDDCDFLLGQADNFIRVDRETGITEETIKKVRKILEN